MAIPPVTTRGYGYRLRDDAPTQLGVDRTRRAEFPGDVASALQQVGATSSQAESTAAIVRASTGLLFLDRFDRADGGLGADWTTINGTWSIVGQLARGTPAAAIAAENVIASVLAAAAERVVQGSLRASTANLRPALRARWDGNLEATANSYFLELAPGVGFLLRKQIAGALTTLVTYANAAIAAAQLYAMKLHVKNSAQKAWVAGGLVAAAADVDLDAATGKAGLRANNTTAASPTMDAEDFAVYSSNVVTVTGLPAGYQVRLNGVVTPSAGGTASIDLAGAMCPLQAIEVLDGFNNVSATLVPVDGVWGGDVYTYTAVTVPQSVQVRAVSDTKLRVEWPVIVDATAYKVEWHNGNGAWAAFPDVAAATNYLEQSGLTEGVTRYYRVTAYRDGVLGAPSATVSGTTLLAAPNNLTITTAAAGGVNLTWTDRSALEVNYQLQRSTDSAAFVDVGTIMAANTGATIDTTPSNGHNYNYRVATIAADGTRSYSNEASCTLSNGTGGLARTATGLLFQDNFNRADGAPGSNYDVTGGGWSIVSNKLRSTNSSSHAYLTAVAVRKNFHAQVTALRGSNADYMVLVVRRVLGGNNFYQFDQGTSGDGNHPRVSRSTGGGFTTLGTGTAVGASGLANRYSFTVKAGEQKAWTDGVLQSSSADATVANDIAGYLTMYRFGGFGSTDFDDLVVCSDRLITCTNLPAGWKIRLGAAGALSGASPGGGPAVTLDPAGAQMPFASIDVIDGVGTVQQSFAPGGGLFGGDTLDWTGAVVAALQSVNVGIGPAGTYDGVVVGLAPSFTGVLRATGGTVLNSKGQLPGYEPYIDTSQSLPLDITFNADVAEVTVRIFDPTFAGNYLIAYNGAGVELGRSEYATGSGFAGISATVTFPGIRKVTISPAVGDFICILDIKFKH